MSAPLTPDALKGLFVKEIYYGWVRFAPATPERILHGNVVRDPQGGVLLFDGKGEWVRTLRVK